MSSTEKPRKPYGSGASYAWTQSYLAITLYIIYLLISDYSIMEATRPDPTIRPPSRYQTGVLRCANGDFSCDLWGKIQIFRCVRVILGDFVIIVLSFKNSTLIFYLLASQFSHLQNPCFSIIIIKFLFTFF